MEIGKPKRVYRIEPLVNPVKRTQESPKVPKREPVKPVPAPSR